MGKIIDNEVPITDNQLAGTMIEELENNQKTSTGDTQVAKTVKRVRKQPKNASNGQKVDADELVKKFSSQAALVMWVNSVQIPNVLEDISTEKGFREIMTNFQKAMAKAQQEAIVAIQQL